MTKNNLIGDSMEDLNVFGMVDFSIFSKLSSFSILGVFVLLYLIPTSSSFILIVVVDGRCTNPIRSKKN